MVSGASINALLSFVSSALQHAGSSPTFQGFISDAKKGSVGNHSDSGLGVAEVSGELYLDDTEIALVDEHLDKKLSS